MEKLICEDVAMELAWYPMCDRCGSEALKYKDGILTCLDCGSTGVIRIDDQNRMWLRWNTDDMWGSSERNAMVKTDASELAKIGKEIIGKQRDVCYADIKKIIQDNQIKIGKEIIYGLREAFYLGVYQGYAQGRSEEILEEIARCIKK